MKILLSSTEEKMVGIFPQIDYDEDFCGNESSLLLGDLLYEKIDFQTNIHPSRVSRKGKLTDVLSTAFAIFPYQLVSNLKLVELFKVYSGADCSIGEISVKHRKKEYNYSIINITERLLGMPIDFTNHRGRVESGEQYLNVVPVKTEDDYSRNKTLSPVNLPLQLGKYMNYHFFVMPRVNLLLVSDELSEAIARANISGIKLLSFTDDDDISIYGRRKLSQFY